MGTCQNKLEHFQIQNKVWTKKLSLGFILKRNITVHNITGHGHHKYGFNK